MKKFIGYILTVLIIMQTISTVNAMEVTSIDAGAVVSHYQQLLNLIGIDISMEDTHINRGEFAVLTAKLMGEEVSGREVSSSFSDISEYYLYKNEIETVKEYGLMTGYGDKFEPVKPVTLQEALKVLVTLAGYGELAEKKGGYPAGYINVASALKLTKGIKSSFYNGFDKETAYRLAFNLLEVPVFEMGSITANGDIEYNQSADTYGKEHFGIVKIWGRVTASEVSALSGYTVAGENRVTIGNTSYYAKEYVSEYLGHYVDAYIREVAEKEYEVIYCETDDNSDYIRIDKEDVVSVIGFDASDAPQYKRHPKLAYTRDGSGLRTLSIGGNLEVSYNGVITTDIENSDFTDNSGYVDVIDTDNDNIYDFVSITNYVNYVVERIDTANNRLVFKDGAGDFKLDDQDIVSVSSGGRTINYGDILLNSVISVRTAKVKAGQTISDSPVIYIDMSTDKIEGKSTVLSTDDNEVTVNGIVYEYDKAIENDFILGVDFKYLLDAFGKIAYIEKIKSDEGEYYFFTKFALSGAVNKKLQFQFVDMNGKVVVFDMPDKLTYTGPDKNGNWVTNSRCDQDKMADIFAANYTSRQLFKLVVTDDKLEKIVAPIDGTASSDYQGYSEEFSLDRTVLAANKAPHDYCIDNVYRFDSGIPIIINNIAGGAEDVKMSKTGQSLSISSLQSLDIYDSSEALEAGLIVAHVNEVGGSNTETWSGWESPIFIVDKTNYVRDDDGNFRLAIHGYKSGQYVSYICADGDVTDNYTNSPFKSYGYKTNIQDLSRGDLIIVDTNNDGEMKGFMSVLTFVNNNIPTDYRFKVGNGEDWGAVLVTYYDKVSKIFDKTFVMTNDPNKIIPITGNICMYDMENDEVKKLSPDETYGLLKDSSYTNPDYVLVRQRRSQQVEIFIFRR